jgi:LPXTG-motif cell wall-anchored protein
VVNDPDDGGAGCLWNSASIGETLIVTATLSIPSGVAEGQYDITTVSQITPTEATATLTVAEPAGPGDPQPQPGPEVLPDTGSSLPLTLSIGTIAALFIAAGIALTRRRATAAGGSEAHPQTP